MNCGQRQRGGRSGKAHHRLLADVAYFAFEQYGPILFGGVKVDWT